VRPTGRARVHSFFQVKIMQVAETTFRRLNAADLKEVYQGATYADGIRKKRNL